MSTVTWSAFRHPYRKQRDYSRFGPFEFNRAQQRRKLCRVSYG
jgi:cbb3-type cytochrome oxidase subunit 3